MINHFSLDWVLYLALVTSLTIELISGCRTHCSSFVPPYLLLHAYVICFLVFRRFEISRIPGNGRKKGFVACFILYSLTWECGFHTTWF